MASVYDSQKGIKRVFGARYNVCWFHTVMLNSYLVQLL